ncbi:endonuclease domain-containing protein [Nostoc sp.]|uniref:endonuclease domain-containing protein n=1 Tax=Nostoc sp. TaxID=1180 RepID=UPI002FFB1EFE
MPKSSARIRGTTPEIEAAAIQLRKKLTPSEKQLWQALRGGKLGGFKFRRQHPVGRFILDFYCPVCKLVIELDGAIHDNQTDYDADRTKYLETYNYKVLRFQNEEVMQQLEKVLYLIVSGCISPQPLS